MDGVEQQAPRSDAPTNADTSKPASLMVTADDRLTPPERKSGPNRTLRLRLIVIGLVVIAGLIGFGSVVVYLNRQPDYGIPPQVVARLSPEMRELAGRLREEPCNRTLAEQFVNGLTDNAEYVTVIKYSDEFNARCGPDEVFLQDVYTAQMGSSDFPAAERTANVLIARYPADPNAYGLREEARKKEGNISGAYEDQRTTLSLFLDPSNVALLEYYDLAQLAAKMGRFCEAVTILRDYIAYDPENRRTQQLATVMQGWQQQGSCAPSSGTGAAFLRYDPNSFRPTKESAHIIVEAAAQDCHLVRADERTFYVPTMKTGWPGVASAFFASDTLTGQDLAKVLAYMGGSRTRGFVDARDNDAQDKTNPAASGSGWPTQDPKLRAKVEKASVDTVVAHYRKEGFTVRSVEDENLGWDLNVSKSGRLFRVEVKGRASSIGAVEVTPNEYTAMKDHKTRISYRLAIVTETLSPRPILTLFYYAPANDAWKSDSGAMLQLVERTGAVAKFCDACASPRKPKSRQHGVGTRSLSDPIPGVR